MTDFTGGTWRSLVDGAEVSAIPDPVASLYEFEDDSDGAVAVDSVGSNNANINLSGATSLYSTNATVGSLSIDHTNQNSTTVSQNTVDLSAGGSTTGFSVACWVNVQATSGSSSLHHFAEIGVDSDNNLSLIVDGSNNYASFLQIGGTNSTITGPSATDGSGNFADGWVHLYAEILSDGTHNLKVNGTQEATAPTALDPINHGSGSLITGKRVNDVSYAEGLVDDFAAANDPLTDTQLQTLLDRAN